VLGVERTRAERGRIAATAALRRLRRPTRSSVELAVKAGVATSLAMWLSERLGLRDSYWAGISAVVATSGTLGASLGASISRITATVVGLLVGLVAFALPVSGTIVSGAAVVVALIALPALSLDTGARLGAATTLIVTAIPGANAVGDALQRGANVPLGCAVAVVVGLVLLPHRAGQRLRAELRDDLEQAGALARSALSAYVGVAAADDLQQRLDAVARATSAHRAALRDATREPGERGSSILWLEHDVDLVEAVVEDVGALVAAVHESDDDSAPALFRAELQHVAEAFAEASAALAASSSPGAAEPSVLRLKRALSDLDATFAADRERRATVEFSTGELARLLSVIRALHGAASALSRLAGATTLRKAEV
jgi:uncharacterized membrane protein YccC